MIVLLVGLLAIPAWASVALVRRAQEQGVKARPQTWVPATAVDAAQEQPAIVLLRWDHDRSLVAPAFGDSLVQQVLVGPGTALATGTPVVRVGRVTRIAASTGQPFDRPLQVDDVGSDVEALNRMLEELGYESSDGDRYTVSTLRGVVDLAEHLGAGYQETFDPGWVIFMPSATATVERVSLVVGAPAPPPGTEIVGLRPSAVEAVVVSPEAANNHLAGSPANSGGPVDTGSGGEAESTPLPATDLDLPAEATVDGVPVGQVDEDGRFPTEVLAKITGDLPARAPTASVTLTRSTPEGAVQIPGSAVVTSASGRTCVVERTNRSGPIEAIWIEVVGTDRGVATVIGIRAPAEVAVAPALELRSLCR